MTQEKKSPAGKAGQGCNENTFILRSPTSKSKFQEIPGDEQLTLTLGRMQTSMLRVIAELEGVDPLSLAQILINKFLNQHWDWQRGKPKEDRDDNR